MSNPNGRIILTIIGAAGIHLAARIAEVGMDDEHVRIVIGAFILIAFLLLIGEFSPEIATGLGTVILVTSFVMNGAKFFQMVGKVSQTPTGQLQKGWDKNDG